MLYDYGPISMFGEIEESWVEENGRFFHIRVLAHFSWVFGEGFGRFGVQGVLGWVEPELVQVGYLICEHVLRLELLWRLLCHHSL